jgi:hypothetical protein
MEDMPAMVNITSAAYHDPPPDRLTTGEKMFSRHSILPGMPGQDGFGNG